MHLICFAINELSVFAISCVELPIALCSYFTSQYLHDLYIEMIPVQNHHVDGLDDVIGMHFKELYVRQIVAVRDSFFSELCTELKISDHYNIHRRAT